MKKILILGAGGFGQMVKETAEQLGYDEIAFLDDAAKGSAVIGKCGLWKQEYPPLLDQPASGEGL